MPNPRHNNSAANPRDAAKKPQEHNTGPVAQPSISFGTPSHMEKKDIKYPKMSEESKFKTPSA